MAAQLSRMKLWANFLLCFFTAEGVVAPRVVGGPTRTSGGVGGVVDRKA